MKDDLFSRRLLDGTFALLEETATSRGIVSERACGAVVTVVIGDCRLATGDYTAFSVTTRISACAVGATCAPSSHSTSSSFSPGRKPVNWRPP